MAPKLDHVVQINEDSWDLNYLHPVAWCREHVLPQDTWIFRVQTDTHDLDATESYVFSFEDQNMAIQFALLYG